MKSLETCLGRVKLRNPILGASGCTGYAYELAPYTDLTAYGAVSIKTVTYLAKTGNPPERVCEVPAGIISSIGLQNPGPDVFLRETMPKCVAALDTDQLIVSVAGDEIDEYVELCSRVEEMYGDKIAALELNASCPNVSHGVGYFSKDAQAAYDLITEVKNTVKSPVLFKFNTNFENYLEVAKSIEKAEPDAIYTSNTPLGMKIDIKSKRPVLGNVVGPICGPAIKAIGVFRTWNLHKVISTPMIASGGVLNWEDIIEYMLAGATAVGVGSAHFGHPDIVPKLLVDLENYMELEKINDLSSLVGGMQVG